ncbi:MAG: AMP-binding protein, partial [Ignavibacteria bacterium]|nr:AMP-binding protein [Ignavibacteria bacterium]
MQRTVINLLRDAAAKYKHTPYLNQKGENGWDSKTFAQVLAEAGNFAAALIHSGFEPNDRIALLAEGRNDWVITEYGILMAGCVNVPLSIKLLPEEIIFRLRHAACKGMIISSNTIEKAIQSLDKVDHDHIRLIYMDADISAYIPLLNEHGLELDTHVLMLNEMYAFGAASTPEM